MTLRISPALSAIVLHGTLIAFSMICTPTCACGAYLEEHRGGRMSSQEQARKWWWPAPGFSMICTPTSACAGFAVRAGWRRCDFWVQAEF